MLHAVSGLCPDCGDERILLPADDDGSAYCCSSCDCAVWLVELRGSIAERPGSGRRQVAV